MAVRTVGGIEDIARQGLIELNRIVGALRRDEHEQLDRRPQPRLDDLPDLVDGARSAGLPVRLEIAGPPRSLPATVELAAYRVVQESLTNALRYARSAPTNVALSYLDGGLDVRGGERRSAGAGRPGAGRPRRGSGRSAAGPGDWEAWPSALSCWAAACTQVPVPMGDSRSTPGCRPASDDPGPGGRRPGAGASGDPHAHRDSARPGSRRRSRGRDGRGQRGSQLTPGRRAHGCPDAPPRRHRGHSADHGARGRPRPRS